MVEIVQSQTSALAFLVFDGVQDGSSALGMAESRCEENLAGVMGLQTEIGDGDGLEVIERGGAWRVGGADEAEVRAALFAFGLSWNRKLLEIGTSHDGKHSRTCFAKSNSRRFRDGFVFCCSPCRCFAATTCSFSAPIRASSITESISYRQAYLSSPFG